MSPNSGSLPSTTAAGHIAVSSATVVADVDRDRRTGVIGVSTGVGVVDEVVDATGGEVVDVAEHQHQVVAEEEHLTELGSRADPVVAKATGEPPGVARGDAEVVQRRWRAPPPPRQSGQSRCRRAVELHLGQRRWAEGGGGAVVAVVSVVTAVVVVSGATVVAVVVPSWSSPVSPSSSPREESPESSPQAGDQQQSQRRDHPLDPHANLLGTQHIPTAAY